MTSNSLLTGAHLRTYNAIFQHPVSHNLGWRDVHTLLRQLGQVAEEPNGNLKVTRNGQTLVLPAPRSKDVAEADEVLALRRFLERSKTTDTDTAETETHWLLVIDHHEARIFRTEIRGTVPQQILPHEPDDFFRHAQNSMNLSKGKEKPDPNSFFEPVAQALQAPGQILVFGTGTGTSSEMDQFIAWLKIHHPAQAQRITGALVVDEHHLTEKQLLAKAREFYARIRTPQA